MAHQALPSNPIAAQLSDFVINLRYEDLPRDSIEAAKAELLDQLACQLMGSTLPWLMPPLKLGRLTRARGEATVVNFGDRLVASEAAFVNAAFGQGCEMDTYTYGRGHIGAATAPVALAMGERERIDGRMFLLASIAGYEVMYRMMTSIVPYNHDRGFHVQGIAGPFAGAVVAGKILNLTKEQMVNAFGIAGSHACGPMEYDQSGGEVKRIHAGLGARGGIHSALLAKLGLTGPPTIIEGKRGFCNLFASKSDPSLITLDLGKEFRTTETCFKMYPAVATVHTAIGAVGKLVREHDLRPAAIKKIKVGLAQKALAHGAGIQQPTDVVGAQFSLAYSLALTVVKRRNVLPDYTDEALWSDPEMVGVMKKIEAHAIPEATGELNHMAAVEIELVDGRSVKATELHGLGTPHNPATATDLNEKARSLAGAVLSGAEIDRLIDLVTNLEKVDDVSVIAKLLAPKLKVNA